jgi:hypothetical protein
MDLAAKDHAVVLPCRQENINLLHMRPTATTTSVEVGLLNGLHKGQVLTCVPSIEPTPDDGLDIVKAVNTPDPTKGTGLEDQQMLGVPMMLNDPNPEANQGL